MYRCSLLYQVTIVAVATLVIPTLGLRLWPNLACHPGYDESTSDPERGEGLVLANMRFCLDPNNTGNGFTGYCYEECLPKRYKFIWRLRVGKEADIREHLQKLFLPDQTESAEKLANKIATECVESLYDQYDGFLCHRDLWDTYKLFPCWEKALAC